MRAVPRFTLWHSSKTRSVRALWAFHEMGLRQDRDFTVNHLSFPPRQHHPEYTSSTNPLGTVPWFEHREAWDEIPRASMSESCAVPQYVAELLQSPLAMRLGVDREYGSYLNWIAHADATLTVPQAVVMRYGLFERGRADAAVDDYSRWFVARLRLLNLALNDGRAFLCGGRLTVADIVVGNFTGPEPHPRPPYCVALLLAYLRHLLWPRCGKRTRSSTRPSTVCAARGS